MSFRSAGISSPRTAFNPFHPAPESESGAAEVLSAYDRLGLRRRNSLIVRDKVTRQCPQTTIIEEKREPKRIRTEVPLLTSLTAYR